MDKEEGGMVIRELQGKYRFLSNFWSCFVEYDGLMYPSVENAYQAAKQDNPEERQRYLTCKASEAKRWGRALPLRDGWEGMKLDIMLQLLREKFKQEPLRSQLLETGSEEIEEGNWWGDTFWGTVNGLGANHLGRLLMQVRGELKNGQ